MVWTDDIVISIHATATPEKTGEAIDALTPIGGLVAPGVTAMRAADFSGCPPIDATRDRLITSP